jgi:hypothetical protein
MYGKVDLERRLKCSKCHEMGFCIQCDYKGCLSTFHTRCAVQMGRIKNCVQMEEELGDKCQDWMPVFCRLHQKQGEALFKQFGEKGLKNTVKQAKSVTRPKKVPKVAAPKAAKKPVRPAIDPALALKIAAIKANLVNKECKGHHQNSSKDRPVSENARCQVTKI